jgi:hypothetical protein
MYFVARLVCFVANALDYGRAALARSDWHVGNHGDRGRPYLSNFHNHRRSYRKRFAAIIEEGISKNEIKKIDAPTAVLIMLHSVNGIESWHRSTAKISAKDLEDNMVLIMVDGLRK